MRGFILLSSICLLAACSHLSQPDDDLRRQYLAVTEPGIGIDTAVDLIKRRLQPEGELLVRASTPCLARESKEKQRGSASIKANMGWYYWGVTRTTTYGEWCFNENNQLIDVIVYKSFDDNASNPDNPGPR